jgi:serine/threonine protein kinase
MAEPTSDDDVDAERALSVLDSTGDSAPLDLGDPFGRRLQAIAKLVSAFDSGGLAETGPPSPPVESWGPFFLREQIGRGRFGVVCRAFDPAVQREIAVKLYAGDELPAEPRLMARVRHPNVVTVLGAAVHDGRPGIWMELVHGHTLAERVQLEGPVEAREAVRIGLALCAAVDAVHAAGLVHQDIKPQNVMEDESGRVVLMDFGAGRAQTDDLHGPDRLSGTPLYMAPEVVLGQPPSVRSDVYGLGVLLYYLLTGTYPVYAAGIEELRSLHARHHHRSSLRRFVSSLRELRPGVSPTLARCVAQALAPAGRRYASAAELRAALEGIEDGRERWSMLRRRISVWVLALLSAAAGGAGTYWLARTPPRRPAVDAGQQEPSVSARPLPAASAEARSGATRLRPQRTPGLARQQSMVAARAIPSKPSAIEPGPPTSVRRPVIQGTVSLKGKLFTGIAFATDAPGALDASMDWTPSEDNVVFDIARADCTYPHYRAGTCPIIVSSRARTPDSHRTVSIPSFAAGAYQIFIFNGGTSDETINYEIDLTSQAPTRPTHLSALSGSWTGLASVTSCRTDKRSPYPVTMTWTVTDAGDVSMSDSMRGGAWTGNVTPDLQLSLQRTAPVHCGGEPVTYVTSYSGAVQVNLSSYTATIVGSELPCPHVCADHFVWNMTRQ